MQNNAKNKLIVKVSSVGKTLAGNVNKKGDSLIVSANNINDSIYFKTNKIGNPLNIVCNKNSNSIVFTCNTIIDLPTTLTFLVQEGVFILSDGKKLIVQKDE